MECLVYIDDVFIFGKSFEEHLSRLKTVLDRFKVAGIKLSSAQCNLFQTSVKFLGHEISSKGIFPDKEKNEKIQNWPKPTTVEQLNTFLGFTNYYRKFINKYEALTTPIEKLFDNGDEKFRYKKKTKIIEWKS